MGNTAICELLILNGVAINSADLFGRTPLHLAVLFNKLDFCIYLVGKGAELSLKDICLCLLNTGASSVGLKPFLRQKSYKSKYPECAAALTAWMAKKIALQGLHEEPSNAVRLPACLP